MQFVIAMRKLAPIARAEIDNLGRLIKEEKDGALHIAQL